MSVWGLCKNKIFAGLACTKICTGQRKITCYMYTVVLFTGYFLGYNLLRCTSFTCIWGDSMSMYAFSLFQSSPLPPRLHDKTALSFSDEDTGDSWVSLNSIAAGSLSSSAEEPRDGGRRYEESERPSRRGSGKKETKKNEELG